MVSDNAAKHVLNCPYLEGVNTEPTQHCAGTPNPRELFIYTYTYKINPSKKAANQNQHLLSNEFSGIFGEQGSM